MQTNISAQHEVLKSQRSEVVGLIERPWPAVGPLLLELELLVPPRLYVPIYGLQVWRVHLLEPLDKVVKISDGDCTLLVQHFGSLQMPLEVSDAIANVLWTGLPTKTLSAIQLVANIKGISSCANALLWSQASVQASNTSSVHCVTLGWIL